MNLQFVNTAVNNSAKVLRKSNNDHTLKGQLIKTLLREHHTIAFMVSWQILVSSSTFSAAPPIRNPSIGLANQFFGVL